MPFVRTDRHSMVFPTAVDQPRLGRTTTTTECAPTTANSFDVEFRTSCWISKVIVGVCRTCAIDNRR